MPYKNGKEVYNKVTFTDEELLDIKESYLNGESSVKIGKRYNTSHKPILRELHNMGIEVSQKRFARKYNINESYFDEIDTQNKAYIMGFLSADGCNFPSKSTISMSLEECDKEILEKICKEMDNTHPLEFIDYSNKKDFGYTYKDQYRMLIFSSHMCNKLEEHGVIPNKSLRLQFPENLDDDLKRHYLRGYFDGDGTLGYKNVASYIKKNRGKLTISIVSTNDFCKSAKEFIENNLDVECSISEPIKKNGVTSTLLIKAKYNTIFLDWLYKDANLFLKRKHDIYLNYINDFYAA